MEELSFLFHWIPLIDFNAGLTDFKARMIFQALDASQQDELSDNIILIMSAMAHRNACFIFFHLDLIYFLGLFSTKN